MRGLRPAFLSAKLATRASPALWGTLLAPANHVLTAALRALGLAGDTGFQNYPRLLNRARWSARAAAGVLPRLLVAAFSAHRPADPRAG